MSEIDALPEHVEHLRSHPSEPRAEVTTLLRMPFATRKHIKHIAQEHNTTMNTLMLALMSEGYESLMRKWEQEEQA